MTRPVVASPQGQIRSASMAGRPAPGSRVRFGDPRLDRSSLLIPALAIYEQALDAHLAGLPSASLHACAAGASPTELALQRWCAAADTADRAALDRMRLGFPAGAEVLDLGCGPGRHCVYLHNAGLDVLGVDASAAAVELTRRAGATALHADALGTLPRPGAGWDGVLLLDGNIGIGGNPLMALAESPQGCSSKVPTLCVGQGSAWGSSRSAMATGSSQWGQGPPRPMRVQGWLQSGHHCWAW